MNEKDFQQRLQETFRLEAQEHIQCFTSCLIELEAAAEADVPALVERAFREVHSLKGAARAVDASVIESLCQSLESCFAEMKNGRLSPETGALDTFHTAMNLVSLALDAPASVDKAELRKVLDRLKHIDSAGASERPAPGAASSPEEQPAADPPAQVAQQGVELAPGTRRFDTIRAAAADIDAVFQQTEELLILGAAIQAQARETLRSSEKIDRMQKTFTEIRRSVVASVDTGTGARVAVMSDTRAAGLVRELEQYESDLVTAASELALAARRNRGLNRHLQIATEQLLACVKTLELLPFSSLLDPMPKLARDLAREQGKLVRVMVQGAHVQVDRRILEGMREPLLHLIRNAVDHGIEPPAERAAMGKEETGAISIQVKPVAGGHVEMLIRDDGRGIGTDAVQHRAQELGLLSNAESHESGDEAAHLIFRSGLSTSGFVSDLSGRGLGLAIVREKVEGLGGSVQCESSKGAGTTFRFVLPVTLATFRAVEVQLGDAIVLIPATALVQALRIAAHDIPTAANRRTVRFGDCSVAVVSLGAVLGLKGGGRAPGGKLTLLVLENGGTRIAFEVDAVRGEREIMMKALGPQLRRVPNIAGACILEAGKPALVLNVDDLMNTAVREGAADVTPPPVEVEKAQAAILVVDDSITSRTLLRDILRSAGYRVTTAEDGMDAFTRLRERPVDVVVSDVDMPRMNGFDLTARIRSDKNLAETPVILVTALSSREDRERGMDVGANAYIVKSSFDQSNLLEIIRRFV